MRTALLLLATFFLACEPMSQWNPKWTPVPVRERNQLVPPANAAPSQLKVMAWNVKYGAGRIDFWFDLWGDRVEMTRAEVEQNLEGLTRLINEVQPDVLIAEEIEVGSRRSAYVDMVRWVLEHTSLNYAAFATNWQSRYVPTEGVGRVEMGNAVFSRYPIVSADRVPHSERTDQDALTTYFYLHRSATRAVIELGGKQVVVYGVHTEAYDKDGTKARHLQEILAWLAEETLPTLVGGDFNAVPPTALRTQDFPDEHESAVGTDFETAPYVLSDMQPFYDLHEPAIALAQYGTTEAEQRRYYTHSLIGPDKTGRDGQPGFWTRTLDYLFVKKPGRFVTGTGVVLQKKGDQGITSEPLLLSDHAPVLGTWEVQP